MGILADFLTMLFGSNDGSASPTGLNVQDRGDHDHVTVYSGPQEVRTSFDESDKGVGRLHSTSQKSRDKK